MKQSRLRGGVQSNLFFQLLPNKRITTRKEYFTKIYLLVARLFKIHFLAVLTQSSILTLVCCWINQILTDTGVGAKPRLLDVHFLKSEIMVFKIYVLNKMIKTVKIEGVDMDNIDYSDTDRDKKPCAKFSLPCGWKRLNHVKKFCY